MTTTIEQIKEALRQHIAEAEAATPGPWIRYTHGGKGEGETGVTTNCNDVAWTNFVGLDETHVLSNATFIAYARTMSPLVCKCLLMAIERLENVYESDSSESREAGDILNQLVQNWINNQTTKP